MAVERSPDRSRITVLESFNCPMKVRVFLTEEEKRVRIRARKAVESRAKRGTIPRVHTLACVDCGEQAARYDHHRGYSREHCFDVQPVCMKCDGLRMRKRGEHASSGLIAYPDKIGPKLKDGHFRSSAARKGYGNKTAAELFAIRSAAAFLWHARRRSKSLTETQ